jgi:hypothetical protein
MRRLLVLLVVYCAAFPAAVKAQGVDDNPAAVAVSPGNVMVFVRGADGTVLVKAQTNGVWAPTWSAIPGVTAASGPAVALAGNTIHLYVRGVDTRLYQNAIAVQNGVWRGWEVLPGAWSSAPAASWMQYRSAVEVFTRGLDDQLWWGGVGNGGAPSWTVIPGKVTSGAAVFMDYNGRTVNHVLSRSTTGSLIAIIPDSESQWRDLGGYIVGAPAVASAGLGSADIFVRAGDSTLHHRTLTNGTWRRVDGTVLASSPGAVSDDRGRALVFARVGEEIWTLTVFGAGSDAVAFGPWTSLGVPNLAPPPPPPPPPDTDGDGVLDSADRCGTLAGTAIRSGCPTGLLADPSIRYRVVRGGIRVIAYYVKATKGARGRDLFARVPADGAQGARLDPGAARLAPERAAAQERRADHGVGVHDGALDDHGDRPRQARAARRGPPGVQARWLLDRAGALLLLLGGARHRTGLAQSTARP